MRAVSPGNWRGEDYIEIIYGSYVNGENIGGRTLAQAFFHRRMFCMAYALAHGLCEFEGIPGVYEISETFAAPGGLSFAFMNISKISNDGGNYQSDWKISKGR